MDASKFAKQYEERLNYLSMTPFFGKAAITHFCQDQN